MGVGSGVGGVDGRGVVGGVDGWGVGGMGIGCVVSGWVGSVSSNGIAGIAHTNIRLAN